MLSARYRLVIEPWLAMLAQRRDSWVFQEQTVVQIVEEIFADYQQARLAPAWRWDLADAAVYPKRSLCIQYQETDLQFVQRLLREEGLFCWFEHTGDQASDSLGSHTLVIADHNGAFTPNEQPRVRYTQSSAVLKEDSLTRWRRSQRVHTAGIHLASGDYASRSLRAQTQAASAAVPIAHLQHTDLPGAYAYEDNEQGARLALRQMQAIDARRAQMQGRGSVRTTRPGSTFSLSDHPVHDGRDEQRDRFVTLAARHQARSNLGADLKAQIEGLLGAIAGEAASSTWIGASFDKLTTNGAAEPSQTDEPIYEVELIAQPAATPVRPVRLDEHGLPDPRLHPRPTIHGAQTALVVGLEGPVHTDRDHRVKVQFHWQRGAQSSHRLNHSAGDNAPAADTSGTWVRVAQSVAGANWGAHFTPRLGQEVVVAFVGGDIDRPVVIAGAYNGSGQQDAQGNQAAAGAAGATGNANPWFPGAKNEGKLQAHQHAAVLAGYKSQELQSSTSGAGGYNQLVFDDSPQANRIELASSTANSRMQLGHLLNQRDNQRLQPRGHGADVQTDAWGALRSGKGLLLSTHSRPGSTAAAHQLDTREAQSRNEQSSELATALADSGQKQNAKLKGEAEPKKLAVAVGLAGGLESLRVVEALGVGEGGQAPTATAAEESAAQAAVFDEQLQFVNARGTPLAKIQYALLLADGSTATGITDDQGRTQRVGTEAPQAIKEATLQPRALQSCCAVHAERSAQAVEPLKIQIQGVQTNEKNVGTSVQQVKTPEGQARGLTAGEIAMARMIFKESIDYATVKVHNGEYLWFGMQPDETAMTPNGEMYFNKNHFKEDFSVDPEAAYKHWFIHEMTHVWQYQLGYPVKARGAVRVGLSYDYTLEKGKKLSGYNMEAQGDVLADYFALRHLNAPTAMRQRQYAASQGVYESATLVDFLADPSSKANLPGGQ